MKSYWNRPEATAETIMDDWFSTVGMLAFLMKMDFSSFMTELKI